jgi:hypothetical protein
MGGTRVRPKLMLLAFRDGRKGGLAGAMAPPKFSKKKKKNYKVRNYFF